MDEERGESSVEGESVRLFTVHWMGRRDNVTGGIQNYHRGLRESVWTES